MTISIKPKFISQDMTTDEELASLSSRVDAITDSIEITKEPTGFVNRTDSVISFDNATRTFTIQPTVDEYSIYIQGVKQTIITPLSIQIPNTYGNYYFSINPNGTLEFTTSFDINILSDRAYISYVLWDDINNEAILFAEERHGLTMDWATHSYLHQTKGLQLVSGANIQFDANGNGTQASDAQVSLSDMTVFDEDIRVQITNDAAPNASFEQILFPIAEIPVYYKNGVKWIRQVATQYPLSFGTVRANYNLNNAGNFSLQQAPNDDDYVATYVFATTNINEPVIALLSQDVYTSLEDATTRANWASISFGDIPFQEIKLLYTIFFKTNSTYTNAVRSKIELVQDFRFGFDKGVSAISQITDHSLLTGLASDDHAQYLNRSGVRPMTGPLSLGSNNITNIGTANGVVIEAHASRHLPEGVDPLITEEATTVSTNGINAQGNANSLSRSNHTHKVEVLSATIKATNIVATTSATDILLDDMTITPPAGTYKIMAHASALLNQNTTMFFSIYVGGVQVIDSEGLRQRSSNNTSDQKMDWNYFDDVVVNGAQAIEIRWRRTSGTATASDRQISYMRVS